MATEPNSLSSYSLGGRRRYRGGGGKVDGAQKVFDAALTALLNAVKEEAPAPAAPAEPSAPAEPEAGQVEEASQVESVGGRRRSRRRSSSSSSSSSTSRRRSSRRSRRRRR